jgi:hypothetical protein
LRKYRPRFSGWQALHDTNFPRQAWVLVDARPAYQYNLPSLARTRHCGKHNGKHKMDNAKWTFGLTMMIVGMGGTFLTLWILGLVMDLLKKVFPLVPSTSSQEKK